MTSPPAGRVRSENILARNCSSNGRGGYTIGSEMSGGVRNVTFEDSTSTGGPQRHSQYYTNKCIALYVSVVILYRTYDGLGGNDCAADGQGRVASASAASPAAAATARGEPVIK